MKTKKPANRHKTGFRGPSPNVGKETQFKPGQSGNPNGKPKRKPITEVLERLMEETVASLDLPPKVLAKLSTEQKKLKLCEFIARTWLHDSLFGNNRTQTMRDLREVIEGKLAQVITGERDGEPIHVSIEFVKPK